MVKLSLFEAYGIEAEYMIVDKNTLNISACADKIFEHLTGEKGESEFEDGAVTWSNELVNHVLEIKCSLPEASLFKVHEEFHKGIVKMNKALEQFDCCLMPTAMHPWMNPHKETMLWPHGQKEIYQKFDEIFGCEGHGWSNLQSVHINLPFANDQEFAVLHSAIRVVLPLIPWLSASSPFVENKNTNFADNRLHFYFENQKKIPEIAGQIIPEQIESEADYKKLYQKIYTAIKPHDPKGVLCHPWVNSRGAIPKFTDKAVEIRLMDIQECPLADMSLVMFFVELIKSICGHADKLKSANHLKTSMLKTILDQSLGYNDFTLPKEYSALFLESAPKTMQNLAQELGKQITNEFPQKQQNALNTIINKGSLAKRIKNKNSDAKQIYQELINCLKTDSLYE